MSDGAQGGDGKRTDGAGLSARLKQLGEGLERRGVRRPGEPAPQRAMGDPSAFARGLRLSAELVGGVILGAGLGWGIDRLFGTSPWGLIIFFLLGFAGGILTIMRSTGALPQNRVD